MEDSLGMLPYVAALTTLKVFKTVCPSKCGADVYEQLVAGPLRTPLTRPHIYFEVGKGVAQRPQMSSEMEREIDALLQRLPEGHFLLCTRYAVTGVMAMVAPLGDWLIPVRQSVRRSAANRGTGSSPSHANPQQQEDRLPVLMLPAGLSLLHKTSARFPEARRVLAVHAVTLTTPYGYAYDPQDEHEEDICFGMADCGPDEFVLVITTRIAGHPWMTQAILPRTVFTDVRPCVPGPRS